MRLVIDKFKIKTDKPLKKDFKVLVCSDLHAGESILVPGVLNFYSLLKSLSRIKDIDVIALTGDFVNNAQCYANPRAKKNLHTLITELAKHAPVVMVRGNHDLIMTSKKTEKLYQAYDKIPNVYLLDNKQMKIGDVNIIGFSPRHASYDLLKHGKRSYKITMEDFRKANLKYKPNEVNITLTHSPHSLCNKTAVRLIPDFYKNNDVILSGHLHNGTFFVGNTEWFRKKYNNLKSTSHFKNYIIRVMDKGVWVDPKTGFVTGLCRGGRYVGAGKIDRMYLPSSKEYIEFDLTGEHKKQCVQITSKGINKYPIMPLIAGRPSVTEIIITGKKTK